MKFWRFVVIYTASPCKSLCVNNFFLMFAIFFTTLSSVSYNKREFALYLTLSSFFEFVFNVNDLHGFLVDFDLLLFFFFTNPCFDCSTVTFNGKESIFQQPKC